jgi:hypothetical protein
VKEVSPFVCWAYAGAKGEVAHLVRVGSDSQIALCGQNAPNIIRTEDVTRRCSPCVRIYLRTMSATDELVGAFDELGRKRA